MNQPDVSGPEGPLLLLEGSVGRDRTHVTPDEGFRSDNKATDPFSTDFDFMTENQIIFDEFTVEERNL